MSTTHSVKFGGVHVRGPWSSAEPVTCELAVYTHSGQARIAELDEKELLRLNREVAEALRQLHVNRIARAGAELQRVPLDSYEPRDLVARCRRTGCDLIDGHIGSHGATS